jgi:hypothetical protein
MWKLSATDILVQTLTLTFSDEIPIVMVEGLDGWYSLRCPNFECDMAEGELLNEIYLRYGSPPPVALANKHPFYGKTMHNGRQST